jgi:hypothetical protein
VSQQINLYEARLRPRHELPTARNLALLALAVLLLMTALALWTRSEAKRKGDALAVVQRQVADEQEKLAALSKTVAARRVSPALLAEQDSARAMLAAGQEVVAFLDSGRLGNTSGFSALMSGFARQSQSDLWLTGFHVAQGGEEIEIRGRLLDPARLPAYVQRLSGEPVFQGRRFAALEMRGVDPDEQKSDQTSALSVADAAAERQAAARLPRFVEFVLRSANAGAADGAPRAGAKL